MSEAQVEAPPPRIIKSEKILNRPLVSTEGKIFHKCHFCAKMFAIEIVRDNHADICPDRTDAMNEVDNNNITPAKKARLTKQKENKTPPKKSGVTKEIIGYELNQENHVSSNKKIIIDSSISVKPIVDNSLKCRFCAETFLNPFEKLKHTREFHKVIKITVPYDEVARYFDNEDKDNCPICSRNIKSRNFKSVFVKHLLTHTQGTIYPCSICYRRFRRKDHMKNHERRHAENNGEEIIDSDHSEEK